MNDILYRVANGTGYVHLNRPAALNALSLDMIDSLHRQLTEWRSDGAVERVWMTGEGRAFCAGGDVKAVYHAACGGDDSLISDFYFREYQLNHHIATYPKPIMALMHGTVMGGGAGLAVNAQIRIATDETIFAMPECAIGFFPDVGASHFLNSCPGAIGMFLGLTGVRLRAAGMLYCGLATHYVPSHRVPFLNPDNLDTLAIVSEASPLEGMQDNIDRCFGLDSVQEINAILNVRSDLWAAETLGMMATNSPFSLAVTHELLIRNKGLGIDRCLAQEYTLSQHMARRGDFREGVRAKLIDRDGLPRWQPERLEEVVAAALDEAFTPRPAFRAWKVAL
ncbi:MAG TPA: enoyl-CoA hydratase/isomerase family protein [Dongiaceae bacterium]|jgi:enoyl-CoA hydratase/carnithine racemase|nr:enoyl-CoA hydratase/isomerase family protein [Dongiaceae bacterium]